MTTVFRWIFVVLAAYILLIAIVSLLTTRAAPEIRGDEKGADGGEIGPTVTCANVERRTVR